MVKKFALVLVALLVAAPLFAAGLPGAETKSPANQLRIEDKAALPGSGGPGLFQGGKANLAEGFEAGVPPAGWQAINVLGTQVWSASTAQFYSGAYSALMEYQGTGGDDWLITPPMYPQTVNDSVTFWLRCHFTGWVPDQLDIAVSTTDSAIGSFSTVILTLAEGAGYPGAVWARYAAPLGAYTGQRIFVAFHHTDTDGDGIYLDDVTGAELVQPSFAHDMRVQSIDNPATAIVPADVIIQPAFTIKNSGLNPESDFGISVTIFDSTDTQVFGIGAVPIVSPDSIYPDSIRFIQLGNNFTPDSFMRYQMVVSTNLAGDENLLNDTLKFNFRTYDLDAGTAAITVPAAGMIGFDTTIAPQATYHNFATEPASFEAYFQIDYLGGPIYMENVVINGLAPGADTTITFPDWAGPHDIGAHDFYAYTVMNLDLDAANDTVHRTVVLNDWVLETVAPLPAARLSHALAYDSDNDKIYLFGGGDGSSYNDNNWQYDPATNSWATMTAMPEARRWSSAVYDNGKIYVLGGYNSAGADANNCWIYDVAGNSWSTGAVMGGTAAGMVGSVAHNGYIYRLGGRAAAGAYLPEVQYYIPTADTVGGTPWTAGTAIPSNWGWGQPALVDDRIWLVGGFDGTNAYANLVYGDIDGTDPSVITWSTGSALAEGDRANNGADAFGDGLLMSGGYLSNFSVTTGNVYHYDIAGDVWTQLPSLPVPDTRMDNLITRTGHNQFFVIGGDTASAWIPSSTVYRYSKIVLGVEGKPTAVTAPGTFSLYGNYPNPVRDRTTISFQLPKAGRANLAVYSITGQLVKTLASENRPAGRHSVSWNGKDNNGRAVSSGVYIYRLSANGVNATGKLVVVK